VHLEVLSVDGASPANDLCMPLQADVLVVPVSLPSSPETTALGRPRLGPAWHKFWSTPEELRATGKSPRAGLPDGTEGSGAYGYRGWKKAV